MLHVREALCTFLIQYVTHYGILVGNTQVDAEVAACRARGTEAQYQAAADDAMHAPLLVSTSNLLLRMHDRIVLVQQHVANIVQDHKFCGGM